MPAKATEQAIETLEVLREEEIDAPIEVVFETLLEQLGPLNEGDGKPMPMKIEAWPGGRWFRDLGNGAGHLWGHVQAIKSPTLLEFCGPLFMSYPAANNVQIRLSENNGRTRLKFAHRAIGLIPPDDREGVKQGWNGMLDRITQAARGASANR
jgi:hypothetical protein